MARLHAVTKSQLKYIKKIRSGQESVKGYLTQLNINSENRVVMSGGDLGQVSIIRKLVSTKSRLLVMEGRER